MAVPGILRIVLTGGIGSGKSTAAQILRDLGALVMDADRIGHEILEPGGAAADQVARRWPSVVDDGQIDRSRLAGIVFSDGDELARLEAIMHPLIGERLRRRVVEAGAHPFVVLEISVPAAFPVGEWFTLVVDAPDDVRRRRLLERGMDPHDIDARLASQPDRTQWRSLADAVIDNSGDCAHLRRQIEHVVERMQKVVGPPADATGG